MKLACMSFVVAIALTSAQVVKAEDVVVRSGGDVVVADRWPNLPLLVTGTVLFVGAYVPSVGVAIANSSTSDAFLAIPIVGPWADLIDRRGDHKLLGCATGAFDCNGEVTNMLLIVTDGLVQGVGAIMMLIGLVPQAHPTLKHVATPTMNVTPMQFGPASLGGGLVGTF